MRKIIVSTFMSLDGVMQAPGGPEEDEEESFEYGGWSVGYWDEVVEQAMGKETSEPFESLLGRKTYDIFASHWPNVEDDGAEIFNNAKKYVVSNNIKQANWQNSSILSGDVISEIKRLKEMEGPDLAVAGSSNLIQSLLKHDLVDEFRLKIYPVVLGKGKRLFGDGTIPVALKLVETKQSPNGVIVATYERSGEIKTGSFA